MKDWTTLITTLGNHISSGNRTEEVDMSMWDTLFPLAKEESCGTHVVRYLATYQGNKYELFTDVKGTPLCINKIIERITLNKKAKQIEWSDYVALSYTKTTGFIGNTKVMEIMLFNDDQNPWLTSYHQGLGCELIGTYYDSLDQAKQACQDHLQACVDGLYSKLQELTEDNL